jgi:hypothetical protein
MSAFPNPKRPAFRKLRGYAFDPSMSLKLDTVTINEIVYHVVWEALCQSQDSQSPNGQGPGPVGEYVEVVDYDPTIKQLYTPVDLNDVYALAMDGLDPSEANPQFHQQMVYAVVMTTIRNFELGLGRKVIWAPRRKNDGSEEYVQRLRIYPHALREANAYYSPQKKALLFGYFQAMPADKARHMPDSLVFTCLSHDIIAHETAHAILDGMYPYYNEPTNPDVLAFHEGFADIVALFQHFTFPEVLRHQIARTRGDLDGQNLLGQLAQEFGSAIGGYGSLRDAIGHIDPKTKMWVPTEPDPSDYESQMEPHARGSILVAAVFEAFLNIYKYQVEDLLRIASKGSGVLDKGALHPDLINRLATEAARCSQRVLHMCIRALDYCPPVDLTFGEYLRGIITADLDLKGEDQHAFRIAFIEAFRRRGIYPSGIKALSVDGVAHPRASVEPDTEGLIKIIGEFLRAYRTEVQYCTRREEIFEKSREFSGGSKGLHSRINSKFAYSSELQKLTGLAWSHWQAAGVADSRTRSGGPRFAVLNLRLVSRTSPKGDQINNIVFSLVQRVGVRVKPDSLEPVLLDDSSEAPPDTMIFRGGCTFVFDLDEVKLKYVITKPLLVGGDTTRLDEDRVRAQYEYQFETGPASMSEFQSYFGTSFARALTEPFALLHQH